MKYLPAPLVFDGVILDISETKRRFEKVLLEYAKNHIHTLKCIVCKGIGRIDYGCYFQGESTCYACDGIGTIVKGKQND